ncbi:Glyoxalase/Bleomycin resistance protein/Dihydroxybiphenyl dioxygenase [Leptodontidium sp. 2 PMI_412]|nr:Glyoxalase/Bleomycin resistance protein/Dihydroxybiphenyl dioxygenase [Leptodontidium sp. 2 PMI_412]
MPILHVSLPVTSLPDSTGFYLAALKPLGYVLFLELDNQVGLKLKYGGPDFWLHKHPTAKDGQVVKGAGVHVAFTGSSRGAVKAFYEAALKAGAKDNSAPGERPQYPKGYYCAYVLDLEGNNIECAYYQPLWLSALQLAPSVLGAGAVGALAWWVARMG